MLILHVLLEPAHGQVDTPSEPSFLTVRLRVLRIQGQGEPFCSNLYMCISMWWAGEESKARGAKPAEPQVQPSLSSTLCPPVNLSQIKSSSSSSLTSTEMGPGLRAPLASCLST